MPRSKSRSRQQSKYRIKKTLYRGNEGPIYLVKDNKNKEWVLKRYEFEHTRMGMDPSLLLEMMLLKRVKGKSNLIQFKEIDYKKTQGEVDLIVEKMDGEIKDLIIENPSVNQIKNYMKQALTGLKNLHEMGVIHNDIKPKNILYQKKGRTTTVKIIDFGLVHLINFPYYRARRIQTTHHYTPPEYRDHREVGRISVNSDVFSLGIIFYYMILPSEYRAYDFKEDYDYMFDPHQIEWKKVQRKVGKQGTDLLRQMIEVHPEKRITSHRALNHPFLGKDKKQSGGGAESEPRRWEVTNLMSKDEYLHRKNQEEFLEEIVEQSIKTKIDVKLKQKLPLYIWNLMYENFEDLHLKFITLNYAIYLMLKFLSLKKIRQDRMEHLAFACLFLSTKFNEYRLDVDVDSYQGIDNKGLILKLEHDIILTLNIDFPIPILLTKEVILYHYFLDIIYKDGKLSGLQQNLDVIGNLYNQYYMLELISSLIYFSPELIQEDKRELVKVVLSFMFPVKHKPKLKEHLIEMLKTKKNLFWIERDLLEFWGIK